MSITRTGGSTGGGGTSVDGGVGVGVGENGRENNTSEPSGDRGDRAAGREGEGLEGATKDLEECFTDRSIARQRQGDLQKLHSTANGKDPHVHSATTANKIAVSVALASAEGDSQLHLQVQVTGEKSNVGKPMKILQFAEPLESGQRQLGSGNTQSEERSLGQAEADRMTDRSNRDAWDSSPKTTGRPQSDNVMQLASISRDSKRTNLSIVSKQETSAHKG